MAAYDPKQPMASDSIVRYFGWNLSPTTRHVLHLTEMALGITIVLLVLSYTPY